MRAFISFIVIGWLLVAHQGSTTSTDAPIPLWSEDIIPELKDAGRNPPGIAFLDTEQLIVHYVAIDTSQLSSRKSPDISTNFWLRALTVDASSGKVTATKEWGTRSSGSSLQVTTGGIIIRTGDFLRLYSKDLRETSQFSLSSDPSQELKIQVSTSGHTALLNYTRLTQAEGLGVSRIEVLDGDTLKPRLTWVESPGIADKYAITDNIIARNRYSNGGGTVVAAEFGRPVWKPIFQLSRGICSPGRSGVFVTEILLVCANQEFVMSSIKGEMLMEDPFGKGEGKATEMVVAQNGSRVAVMVENLKDTWDTGGHIVSLHAVVYDLAERKRIMTAMLSPPQHDYDLAISSDGSKLAILSDRTISVYELPISH